MMPPDTRWMISAISSTGTSHLVTGDASDALCGAVGHPYRDKNGSTRFWLPPLSVTPYFKCKRCLKIEAKNTP